MAVQVTGQYSLGPVKPLTEQAAYLLGPMFGIKDIGGWRQSDPFPDHPSGHALDFMIPVKGDTTVGNALAKYAQDNAGQLGVKYIVWNRQTWNPKRGTWQPYTSTSNPHTDHVHITFNDTTDAGSTTLAALAGPIGVLAGRIPTPGNVTEALTNAGNAMFSLAESAVNIGQLAGVVTKAFLPTNLMRAAAFLFGTMFILIGIWFLAREVKESKA
jgi:hypothetical protein